MPFRVTARTLLQLGAELISSDELAFYELIKNAFDAGSRRVRVSLIIRIPSDDYFELHNILQEAREKDSSKRDFDKNDDDHLLNLEVIRAMILSRVDNSRVNSNSNAEQAFLEQVQHLRSQLAEASSWDELLEFLEGANYIDFADSGEGMTLNDLTEIYLTIGTRSRLKQRNQFSDADKKTGSRPILGEKGLGRLSAMRLGEHLRVTTSRKREHRFNVLEIDWRVFSHDSDVMIEEIPVAPRLGERKVDSDTSGTTIRISSLQSSWSKSRLVEIAQQQFSRLSDPFTPATRFPVTLRFNGQIIEIPSFNNLILEAAHATVVADFSIIYTDKPAHDLADEPPAPDKNSLRDEINKTTLLVAEPRLMTKIDYSLRNRQKTILLESAHLSSSVSASLPSLVALGPFQMKLYWYNRRILTEIDGIGNRLQVNKLINDWGGGLMLFRDGFRVFPYGSGDDDWLDLDRSALGATGYKVNRRQIIGKVDITAQANPKLVDQTNREGLRDNEQKQALRAMLFYILATQFRSFLNDVDDEIKALEPVNLQEVGERVDFQKKEAQKSLDLLKREVEDSPRQKRLIKEIQIAVDELSRVMEEVTNIATSYEKGRSQLVHLAGIGLMVESIAHELHRATSYTLNTIAVNAPADLPINVEQFLDTLEAQMKTLQTRLRVLDPLQTNARQQKSTFDLVSWVRRIVGNHKEQFARHDIISHFQVEASNSQRTLQIKAVKGMIVQILENLIGNAVYWLEQQKIIEADFRPEITIIVRLDTKQIICTDNGPGVSLEQREDIFKSFYTTKPPGDGRGLGLFISREIAVYHNATLELSPEPTSHPHRLNTFILSLEK